MKIRILVPALALCGFLSAPRICLAQEKAAKAPDPYAFVTRSYRLPADDLITGFVSKERGKLRAPAMPPASASNGEVEAFLKSSHEVAKEYLALHGIMLPGGSLACYDPESQTLVLRAMNMAHDLMAPLAEMMRAALPKHVAWSLEILEAPAAEVRAAVKEAAAKANHLPAYEQLLAKSKVAVSMRGETKSGAPTNSTEGGRAEDSTEYSLDAKNHVTATKEELPTGTQLDLEPTVGADGKTLDLNISLTHPYARPLPRWELLAVSPPEAPAAEWLDRPRTTVKTSLTMIAPATKLLGVWTLDGAPEPERAGAAQAAFIHSAIVPLLPLEDARAEQLLKAHGEKVIPTPKAVRPVTDPALPPGMIVRRFRVPRNFLSADEKHAPADPFAGAPANEPRFTRNVTVEEMLRAAGLPFPEGSSANFSTATGELIVRNTPENLDRVQEHLYSLRPPLAKLVSFTFQIVQADAALIRRLQRETLALPDHRAAWKAIEDAVAANQAKIVRFSRTDTGSGSPFSYQNAIEFAQSSGLEVSSPARTTTSEKKEGQQAAASAEATIVNSGDAARDRGTTLDRVPVGLHLEAEPTLGADGATVDVNISVKYDYALPAQRMPASAPAGTIPLAAPALQFHDARFKTSTTMLSGSTRLLSVWKPRGAPELEGDVLQAAFLRLDVVPVE